MSHNTPLNKPTQATSTFNADTLLARSAVSLARSQRLVDSWLPSNNPQTHPASKNSPLQFDTTDNDLPATLEDGRPSTLGLGAIPIAEGVAGLASRNGLSGKGSELEKLRERLVGRRKIVSGRGARVGVTSQGREDGEKMQQRRRREAENESGDEEVGRAEMFRSRRGKRKREGGSPSVGEVGEQDGREADEGVQDDISADPGDDTNISGAPQAPAKRKAVERKRRGTSFLDEVLAERAKKSSKKKKKHKHDSNETNS